MVKTVNKPIKLESRVGQVFGRLTVTSIVKPGRDAILECLCSCGTVKWIGYRTVLYGNTTSCGCYQREVVGNLNLVHGDTYSTEHWCWLKMRARCYLKKDKSYLHYGGRGITVCDRWKDSYENFLADMGRRPTPAHSIGRIDNEKPYSPENCRWETPKQQANNRRSSVFLEFDGRSQTMIDWATELGINYKTLKYRIRNGWDLSKALGPLTRKQCMARRKKPVTETQMALSNTPGTLLVIQPPTQEQIAQALSDARAAVSQLQAEAEALVITDQLTYTQADSLLNRVMNGEKVTEEKFRPIITPLREPLDWIYETRREVDRPLAAVKLVVKGKMGVYQLQEKQRLDAEHAENMRKAQEISARMAVPVEFPEQPPNLVAAPGTFVLPPAPQVTYLAPPSTPAPTAVHSFTRFEKRVRTTDPDLLVDYICLCGRDDMFNLLTIKPTALQEFFTANPERVASWPGVEVYDHPIITGRS